MTETEESIQAYENDQNRTSVAQQIKYERAPWWLWWVCWSDPEPPIDHSDVPRLGRPDTTSRRWM